MKDLKIPEEITEFSETGQFSAVKDGKEYIINLVTRTKREENQEKFYAVTFGYSVEGSDRQEVLEEMLRYIASQKQE